MMPPKKRLAKFMPEVLCSKRSAVNARDGKMLRPITVENDAVIRQKDVKGIS
jgi:hypothetical protein